MLIEIQPPDLGPARTRITSDVSSGATAITVANNDDFADGDYVILGKVGEEKTELVTLTGTTNNDQLDSSAAVFDHAVGTPATEVAYDQVQIARASSESGSYSAVATIDLNLDEETTTYDDADGSTTSWYKVRYKDSDAGTYSAYSDPVQGTGYTTQSLYAMTNEVLEEFGDPNADEVSRDQVERYLRAGVRLITRAIIGTNPDYRRAYTTEDLTSGTTTYDLPTRFLAFIRMDVNLDGTEHDNAYKAEFESEQEGLPDTEYSTQDPRVFFRGEKFGIRPEPAATGKVWMWYWDYPEEMTDPTDTHGLPYGARDLLVAYALSRLWQKKNIDKSMQYKDDYNIELSQYLEFVASKRQKQDTQKIQIKYGRDLYAKDIAF